MALEMLPMKEVLVVPNPGPMRRGDAAVNAADNTWPVVLLGLAVVIMFILARRGARAFSFALSFHNLWWFLGVQSRFRVTVHSCKSSGGSPTCFVTTCGKFSPDLSEEDDSNDLLRPDQFCISTKGQSTCRKRRDAGAPEGSSGIQAKMVFMYDNDGSTGAASAFTACTSDGTGIATADLTVATPFENVENVVGEVENVFRQTIVVEETDTEILEMLLPTSTCKDLGLERRPSYGCPECQGKRRNDSESRKDGSKLRKYPWDAAVKLRLEYQTRSHSKTPTLTPRELSRRSSFPPTKAVRGTSHTATLGENVVKIWDNPSRRMTAVLPTLLSTTNGTVRSISSLDVDWEKKVACLGSSDGVLTLWDLERANSQTTLTFLNFGSTINTPVRTAHGSGLMFTAGRPSRGEPGDCRLCAWDPRTFYEAAAAGDSVIARRSSPLRELSISGFELDASTCCGLVSTHDIRMLSASALSFSSTHGKTMTSGTCRSLGNGGTSAEMEEWWKPGNQEKRMAE